MGTIYKYELSSHRETELRLPVGADILRVDIQENTTCLWAIVEPDAPKEVRVIEVFGTGHAMPNANRKFINTFLVAGGEYVFHAFERI